MTIALKIGSEDSQIQGFIYLDAVTQYGRDFSGKVTSFPVDSGANISDHYIARNPKFTIRGVFSSADITGMSSKVLNNNVKPINARDKPRAVNITGQSKSLQFLPSAVSQFFERSSPQVNVADATANTLPLVEMLLEELMAGTYYNQADNRWRNKMTGTVLYEMNGTNFAKSRTDLIITDVSFEEDPDSGDALIVSISLEKIRLVSLSVTDMPKKAATPVKKKVAETEKKGVVDTVKGAADTAKDGVGGAVSDKFGPAMEASKEAHSKITGAVK